MKPENKGNPMADSALQASPGPNNPRATAPTLRQLAGKFSVGLAVGIFSFFLWFLCAVSPAEDGSLRLFVSLAWGTLPAAIVSGYAAALCRHREKRTHVQAFLAYGLPLTALLILILKSLGTAAVSYLTLKILLQMPCFILGIIPEQAADFAWQIAISMSLSEKNAGIAYTAAGLLITLPWSWVLVCLLKRGGALLNFIREELCAQAKAEQEINELIEDSIARAGTRIRLTVRILFGRENPGNADQENAAAGAADSPAASTPPAPVSPDTDSSRES